jgi:hypothetical protein
MQTEATTAKPCRLRIVRDDCFNASEELEYLYEFGTFATWHRRYDIGKVQPSESPDEFLADQPENSIVIPIYMYEHGGRLFSTAPFSCPWDSGQLGVWVVTPDDLRATYGEDTPASRIQAARAIAGAIEYMNEIESGNVWGYEVLDFDGEVCDSCWGFVGDDAHEQIWSELPSTLHEDLKEAWENRE